MIIWRRPCERKNDCGKQPGEGNLNACETRVARKREGSESEQMSAPAAMFCRYEAAASAMSMA